MRKLVSKPFHAEDAMTLVGRAVEKFSNQLTECELEILEHNSISRTWRYNDTIIGCGGIVIYEKGKCEAWSIVDNELALHYKRELLVGARRFLEEVAKENNITYMQASWQMSFNPNIHWLEHLGFTKEDRKVKILNMESYVYSRRFTWEFL